MSNYSWLKYAIGEGLMKMTSKLLSKLIGLTGGVGGVMWANIPLGIVQGFGGLAGAYFNREPLVPSSRAVMGSLLFGVSAFAMTVLGFYSFTFPNTDVGIATFIATLTIIPGIFIDWIFFKNPLSLIQWLGIGMFLLAGYAMFDFPPLSFFAHLPTWIVLWLLIALLGGLNEGITRAISRVSSPFANNFWVGMVTILLGLGGVAVLHQWNFFGELSKQFWVVSFIVGAIVLAMISFKLLAYKNGGTIAFTKVVMFGTYLTTVTFAGILFYHEPLTVGKIFGILGFFLAYAFTDKATFASLQNLKKF